MQPFVKPQFICGVLLLLATIGSAKKNNTKGVTIKQITEPSDIYKSPFWDHEYGKLYASDSYRNKLVCLNVATGKMTYANIANRTAAAYLGPAVPVKGRPNQFVAGSGTNFVLFTWDSDKNSTDTKLEILATVDPDKPDNQLNDGNVDSCGRFWAGTKGPSNDSAPLGITEDLGSVYYLSGRSVVNKISPVSVSDGIAWNKESTVLYYIDSGINQLVAYDFDAKHGNISNKRLVFDLPSSNISGLLDGITVDTDGNLWVTLYGSVHVVKIDPLKGKILQIIEMPTDQIVSITFGGKLLDTLFVTSLNFNQPGTASGAIFAVEGVGVRGFAANKFSLNGKHC